MKRKRKNTYLLEFPDKELRKKVKSLSVLQEKTMRDVIIEGIKKHLLRQGNTQNEKNNTLVG